MKIQMAALLVAVAGVVGVQQLMPWATVLRDPVSLAHFQEIYSAPIEATEVDFDYVSKGVEDGSIQVIDARLPSAFGLGHLPNAINWPVDASTIESRAAFEQLSTRKPVIVYCESDRCSWADAIAIRLSSRGAKNVFIFRGGYREWQSKSN